MGLEAVEFVLDCEEAFGVGIADAEAEKLRTPRQAADCIWEKLRTVEATGCQTQRAFYRIRRAVCARTGQPRNTITPESLLADLLPSDMTGPDWQAVLDALPPGKWPAPVRPPGLARLLMNLVCLAGIVLAFVLVPRLLPGLAADCGLIGARFLVLLAAACLLGPLAAWLTRSRRRCFPPRFRRVRDLIPYAAAPAMEGWSRELVAAKVRELVLKHCDPYPNPDKYNEDADFYRDLGWG